MKKKRQKIQKTTIQPDRRDPRVGEIGVSAAGHDKGTLLVVIAGLDEKQVLVADGRTRKLTAPKKKKMQHLRMLTRLCEEDTEVLREGSANDAFLRKKLSALKLTDLP